MAFWCVNAFSINVETKLQIVTNKTSLKLTQATNTNPALCPLFKLCLIIAKITGPILMASKIPNVNPVIIA